MESLITFAFRIQEPLLSTHADVLNNGTLYSRAVKPQASGQGTKTTQTTLLLMGGFIGVAWVCQFQVIVMCYLTFKRAAGLYFWSMIAATVFLIFYTIGIVLNRFVPGTLNAWSASIIILVGYLLHVPAEFMVMYSRLCLLKPDWKLTRFIQILLAAEYLFVEVPIGVLTLVAVHNLHNAPLVDTTRRYIAVGAVILPIVCMIVPVIYLYLAYRMFAPNANRETKDLLICLIGGTFMVFAFQAANIATWYTQETSLRGCWLPLLLSVTLLLEFWNLNILGKLASRTMREAQELNFDSAKFGNQAGSESGQSSNRGFIQPTLETKVAARNSVLEDTIDIDRRSGGKFGHPNDQDLKEKDFYRAYGLAESEIHSD